jgi:hypothetical protein
MELHHLSQYCGNQIYFPENMDLLQCPNKKFVFLKANIQQYFKVLNLQ